jgi:hypothetical protein
LFDIRGSFPALAAIHLVTLGFMLQAMCGGLLQVAPVAAGANVWKTRAIASIAYLGLNAGVLAFVGGLVLEQMSSLRVAAVVLFGAMTPFALAVLYGLLRTPARGVTVPALRLAVVALAVTVVLGASLAATFAWGLPIPVASLAAAHAGWAVFGWSLTLVAAVSYLSVPMFQITPAYPAAFALWLPRAIVAASLVWSLAALFPEQTWLRVASGSALLTCGASFAAVTLRLQRKRRRKVADITLLFYRVGMTSMLLAAAIGLTLPLAEGEPRVRLEIVFGVLVLAGFFVSVINGMLYKIVPFISWLHLQRSIAVPPTMNQIIPSGPTRGQFRLHMAAVVCLVAAAAWPPLIYPAGALLAASCGWLEWNLIGAVRLHVRLEAAARSEARVA